VQDQQGSKSTHGDPKKDEKNIEHKTQPKYMFRHTQSADIGLQ